MGSTVTDLEPRAMAYQPALDGVRAVAVVLVLLFHHGFSWMSGGYVGVSVFFTLSGYLITSLLLVEHQRSGRISLSRFYARRMRRLLPAGLLCLVGIALLSATGEFAGVANLRREVIAAVLQVANWNLLANGDAYEAVQGVRSPVLHFWSLAVEEQFYWMWPLLMVALLAAVRGARGRVAVLVGLAVAAVVAAPLMAQAWGPDVAYLSTPARLGEILVGAALAAVLHAVASRQRWWQWLTLPAIASIVAAAAWWPAESGPAYEGWLAAGSLVSAALILGLQSPGPITSLLSARPLVALGKISYGVYLYHWPVFLVLDGRRAGGTGWSAFALRVVVAVGLAALSYLAIERPIRSATVPAVRVFPAVAAAMTVVVVVAVSVTADTAGFGASAADLAQVSPSPTTAPLPALGVATSSTVTPASSITSTSAVDTTGDGSAVPTTSPRSSTTAAPTTVPTPSRPVRVLVLGDSTAMALSAGLVDFAKEHPQLIEVEVLARIACGFVRQSDIREDDGSLRKGCDAALDAELPIALRERTPDVVIAFVTIADAAPRTWQVAEGEIGPDDSRYQQRMRSDYATLRSALLQVPNLRVAWLTTPPPAAWYLGYYDKSLTAESFQPLNATVATMDDADPARVRVIDFEAWLVDRERQGDTGWRSDGLHLDAESADQVVDELLWPELMQLVLS